MSGVLPCNCRKINNRATILFHAISYLLTSTILGILSIKFLIFLLRLVWKELGDLSKEQAKQEYVSKVTEVSPGWLTKVIMLDFISRLTLVTHFIQPMLLN